MKLQIEEIELFRESVAFLDRSSQAVCDRFDDSEFRKEFYIAVARCKDLAQKLGAVTVTVRV